MKYMYRIIGRSLCGVKVIGYMLENVMTFERGIYSKKQTEELALNKQIVNCTAQIYKDKIIIKGIRCKLVELPDFNENGIQIKKKHMEDKHTIVIVSRVMRGKHNLAYVLEYRINNNTIDTRTLEREKVLNMAREGLIENARVQKLNNRYLLRGVKCELSQLPVIRA